MTIITPDSTIVGVKKNGEVPPESKENRRKLQQKIENQRTPKKINRKAKKVKENQKKIKEK